MSSTLKSGGSRLKAPPLDRKQRRMLVAQLQRDGARIAERFGLKYRAIEAESARVKRRYGSCHSDGVIKIRLAHAKTGRPLKYSSMIATLCHEIAHLKYFHHGPRFRDFYEVILDWARREGIYRPDSPGRTSTQAGADQTAAKTEKPSAARQSEKPVAVGQSEAVGKSEKVATARKRRSEEPEQLVLL